MVQLLLLLGGSCMSWMPQGTKALREAKGKEQLVTSGPPTPESSDLRVYLDCRRQATTHN